METVEEDKLNLKSVLSQYLFVVLVEQKMSGITAGSPAKKQIGRSWAIIWKCREGQRKDEKYLREDYFKSGKDRTSKAFGVVFLYVEKQRNKDGDKRIKG